MEIVTFLIIFCFVCSFLNTILIGMLWIEVKAMQKSTHQVQYVNMHDTQFQAMTKELKEKLTNSEFGNII